MGDRRKPLIKTYLLINLGMILGIAAICLLSYWQKISGFPLLYCLSHQVLHIYCPLCGGTRAIKALLRLDILLALKTNAFAVCLLCVGVFFDVRAGILAMKGDLRALTIPRWVIWSMVAAFGVYFILRNVFMIVFGIDPLGDLVGFWN